MANVLSGRVRLGVFEVDLKSGELHSIEAPAAKPTLLREQVLQVLRLLVERSGEIVTREEIKSKLWADDTVVEFDQSINATIKSLRRALGDSADEPRYIETLARRGYRLMVPIEYQESSPETTLEQDPDQRGRTGRMGEQAAKVQRRLKPAWWKIALLVAPAVILAGVGYISWRHSRSTAPPTAERIRLAVLPFENLTGDPNKEYLADGLTEETISQLGRLDPKRLAVIARTSVMGYKHKDEHLDQIGRDLSVQYVLEDSLRQNGDHIRLTAQLIQVKDQTHLWSEDYDYTAKDILNVEDDVASAVAQQIRLRLTSQQQADLTQSHPVNPEAFDAYLRGYSLFERNTSKDAEMAAKYYERATQLDPSYALAWVGLSRVHNWEVNIDLIPAEEGHRLAREEVERALALNPNLAEAHIQMGRIKQQTDFDWLGVDASLRRAIALEPGNPEALTGEASNLEILGRFEEAIKLDRQAVDLDPLNADSWQRLAEVEYFMGQLDKAAADCKKGLELSPDAWPGPMLLSQIYLLQGRHQDALSEIRLVRFDAPRFMLYAIAYHTLGLEKESDAALSELIAKYHEEPVLVAEAYACRNQSNKAFEWLDRAYAQHDSSLIATKIDPLLKSLHNDPRFAELLKKLNLPT
ncbi:winged helix-turn-helix domain-containing tetratricopeptide repeat protein [Acidicapsa acidisoli]|uniref:winged helix-turn-helix domain-containing tetratricopeptide repeat protein n=1 Tax=Acidicapsa acidisoli TaxID=1615681 RepID=UPI0021DF8C69|nr:winged helix-turn-helix domain-containing protein [Acidicapsa acidisoli]